MGRHMPQIDKALNSKPRTRISFIVFKYGKNFSYQLFFCSCYILQCTFLQECWVIGINCQELGQVLWKVLRSLLSIIYAVIVIVSFSHDIRK